MRFAVAILFVLVAGCEAIQAPGPRDNSQEISAEERELLEQVKREKEARRDLERNPDKYIHMVGEWGSYDKGIINTYTRVTNAALRNTSEFDVSDIAGEFTYKRKNGSVMATVPIEFEGELRAGETKRLKARSQEISGGAASGELRIKRVRLRK